MNAAGHSAKSRGEKIFLSERMIFMKNRITSTLILIAMAASAVSCGQDAGADTQTSGGSEPSVSESATETEPDIYDGLPTGDYQGADFNIFNTTMSWSYCALDFDEKTNDVLDDAVYDRTRQVEDKLKIKIRVSEMPLWGGAPDHVRSAIGSGDNEYDLLYMGVLEAAPLFAEKLFADLYSVDGLDLSKPWWDQRSQKMYEVDGKLFMAHGSSNLSYYDAAWVMFYNKAMLETLGLDPLYSKVDEGKWTFDELQRCMTTAAADLDGDNDMDENDRFGLIVHAGATLALLHGADERGIAVENGRFTVPELTQRMDDVVTRIQSIFTNKKEVLLEGDKALFSSGHTLFLAQVLGASKGFRSMMNDFGIIPLPKYDEAQSDYISYLSPSATAALIPSTLDSERLSRSAVVLENMSALSYETTVPAYYDTTLNGKIVRDDDSTRMLDRILSSCECEAAYVFGFGEYQTVLTGLMTSDKSVASTIESNRTRINNVIDKFYKSFE